MGLSEVVPPASWTIVMASGVVAMDLYTVHLLVPSTITLGFAAAVWLLLAAVLGVPLVFRRRRFRRLAGSPVSLAAVAATAVLGTGLAMYGYRVAAAVLLVIPVLRHWTTPTVGISFVLGVATDGWPCWAPTWPSPIARDGSSTGQSSSCCSRWPSTCSPQPGSTCVS